MYDCIVSLTSWKGRINEPNLLKILFRLIKQQKTSYKYKVCLVLSEEEFPKKYDEIPNEMRLMENDENFEIIWTYENTKALKKLDPTMKKYPDLPIITLDDDELVTENMVEKMMYFSKQNPNKILGSICGVYNGILRVAEIRLFPPHSLELLPTKYFKEYFECLHDDEWNGIRAKIKNTQCIKIPNTGIFENKNFCSQTYSFRKEYSKFNFKKAFERFKKEHPEIKNI